MSNPAQHPDAEDRSKALEAVELRIQGLPYRAIAERLDYADESGARHAVSRLLSRREAEGVSELRAVHSDRLEAVLSGFWVAAIGGDSEAAKIVLRALDSLGKLWGTNAPTRLQVGPEVSEREFAERAAELIAELNPETARDMFKRMPGGPAVLAAGAQTPAGSDDSPSGSGLLFSGQHRPESGTLADDSDDDWSNVGGGTHSPSSDESFDDVPGEVAAAAEQAALTVIAEYRRKAHR